jgi:very-short-patch-repair endonuclease
LQAAQQRGKADQDRIKYLRESVDIGIIKDTVRQLRQNQTESETIVWEIVRDRRMDGRKFYRQYPIRFEYYGKKRFFVADFYCAELKLVLEIDGKIHERQKDFDELRTHIINTLGLKVIRFANEEVQDVDNLIKQLVILSKDPDCPRAPRR